MIPPRVPLACIVLLSLLVSPPTAAPDFGDWSVPLNLGPVVNSASNDQSPAISKDGLSLYFESDRPNGAGANDLWVSRRNSIDEPWGAPENLSVIRSSTDASRSASDAPGRGIIGR